MLTICEQSFLVGRFLVGPTPILSLIDAFAICSTDYRLVFVSDLSVNNKYGQNLSQKFRQLIHSTDILLIIHLGEIILYKTKNYPTTTMDTSLESVFLGLSFYVLIKVILTKKVDIIF